MTLDDETLLFMFLFSIYVGNGKQLVSVYDLYGAPIPSAVIIAPPNIDGYVVSTGEGGSNFATLRPINAPAPNVLFSDSWFNWPFSYSWPDIFPFCK